MIPSDATDNRWQAVMTMHQNSCNDPLFLFVSVGGGRWVEWEREEQGRDWGREEGRMR